MLIAENNWRAQRYGVDESMIDFGRGELVPMSILAEEMIDLVGDYAANLGSLDAVLRVRDITANGTSADRQRLVFNGAVAGGAEHADALRSVVDHLIEETMEGL
jgi:carboxylate-amine ligase